MANQRSAPRRREPEPEYVDDQPAAPRAAMTPPQDGQAWVLASLEYVQHELVARGIAKNEYNPDQKFHFRGVDTVMEVVSGLLVAARVIVTPRVTKRDTDIRETAKGYKRTHTHLLVEYTFRSLVDGSTVAIEVPGEGTDSSDKGTSKAMAMAYKTAMVQTFSIPINGQDVDGDAGIGYDHDHDGDGGGAGEPSPVISAKQMGAVMQRAKELGIKPERICAMYQIASIGEMTVDQFADCERQFDATVKRRQQAANQQQPGENEQ